MITEAAADWAVRLHAGELGAQERAELDRWLAEDERHPPALRFAEQTWAALGQLQADDVPPAKPGVRRAEPARASSHPVRRRSRLRVAARAAALALLVGTGWISAPTLLLQMQADYLTARGEVRRVQLPDGSHVELDSASAISVDYDEGERRIRLLAGSAWFDVAPMAGSESRPFVVESAGGRTRALGTKFVVERETSGQAWVGVMEHSVAVTLQSPPLKGHAETVLQEGQSARYDGQDGVVSLGRQDLQRATSWRRGVLVFDRQPLSQVIEQLNRYRPGRVLLTDSTLATREVSGVFRLDMLDAGLQTLTSGLHLRRLDLPGLSLIY